MKATYCQTEPSKAYKVTATVKVTYYTNAYSEAEAIKELDDKLNLEEKYNCTMKTAKAKEY